MKRGEKRVEKSGEKREESREEKRVERRYLQGNAFSSTRLRIKTYRLDPRRQARLSTYPKYAGIRCQPKKKRVVKV